MSDIEARYDAQQAIQEMIAQGVPLERTLAAICDLVEQQVPDALSSIMLFDDVTRTLSFRAGRHLPAAFRDAAQDLPIGPESAICGAAAFHREVVVSPDILADPNCASYRELARDLQLRSG